VVRALVSMAAIVLGFACSAHAQDALPLALSWQAPAECPDAEAVRVELARVAHARAGYLLTPLSARGEVEQRGAGYVLHLRTEHAGGAGERVLEASDCATLVRSATLVLALAFGPGVELASEPEPLPSTGTSSSGDAAIAPAANQEPARVKAEPEPEPIEDDPFDDGARTPLDVALLAGGSAQLALLPSTAFALTLGVELRLDQLALHVRASALPGVSKDVAADARARFDGLGGALLGCGALFESAVRAELCAGARLSALRGRASGALDEDSAVAPWYALLGAAAARWPTHGALQIRLEAQLAFALNRPRFVIENLGRTHRVPALSPELAAFVVLTP
jgi:hypothetical protein